MLTSVCGEHHCYFLRQINVFEILEAGLAYLLTGAGRTAADD